MDSVAAAAAVANIFNEVRSRLVVVAAEPIPIQQHLIDLHPHVEVECYTQNMNDLEEVTEKCNLSRDGEMVILVDLPSHVAMYLAGHVKADIVSVTSVEARVIRSPTLLIPTALKMVGTRIVDRLNGIQAMNITYKNERKRSQVIVASKWRAEATSENIHGKRARFEMDVKEDDRCVSIAADPGSLDLINQWMAAASVNAYAQKATWQAYHWPQKKVMHETYVFEDRLKAENAVQTFYDLARNTEGLRALIFHHDPNATWATTRAQVNNLQVIQKTITTAAGAEVQLLCPHPGTLLIKATGVTLGIITRALRQDGIEVGRGIFEGTAQVRITDYNVMISPIAENQRINLQIAPVEIQGDTPTWDHVKGKLISIGIDESTIYNQTVQVVIAEGGDRHTALDFDIEASLEEAQKIVGKQLLVMEENYQVQFARPRANINDWRKKRDVNLTSRQEHMEWMCRNGARQKRESVSVMTRNADGDWMEVRKYKKIGHMTVADTFTGQVMALPEAASTTMTPLDSECRIAGDDLAAYKHDDGSVQIRLSNVAVQCRSEDKGKSEELRIVVAAPVLLVLPGGTKVVDITPGKDAKMCKEEQQKKAKKQPAPAQNRRKATFVTPNKKKEDEEKSKSEKDQADDHGNNPGSKSSKEEEEEGHTKKGKGGAGYWNWKTGKNDEPETVPTTDMDCYAITSIMCLRNAIEAGLDMEAVPTSWQRLITDKVAGDYQNAPPKDWRIQLAKLIQGIWQTGVTNAADEFIMKVLDAMSGHPCWPRTHTWVQCSCCRVERRVGTTGIAVVYKVEKGVQQAIKEGIGEEHDIRTMYCDCNQRTDNRHNAIIKLTHLPKVLLVAPQMARGNKSQIMGTGNGDWLGKIIRVKTEEGDHDYSVTAQALQIRGHYCFQSKDHPPGVVLDVHSGLRYDIKILTNGQLRSEDKEGSVQAIVNLIVLERCPTQNAQGSDTQNYENIPIPPGFDDVIFSSISPTLPPTGMRGRGTQYFNLDKDDQTQKGAGTCAEEANGTLLHPQAGPVYEATTGKRSASEESEKSREKRAKVGTTANRIFIILGAAGVDGADTILAIKEPAVIIILENDPEIRSAAMRHHRMTWPGRWYKYGAHSIMIQGSPWALFHRSYHTIREVKQMVALGATVTLISKSRSSHVAGVMFGKRDQYEEEHGTRLRVGAILAAAMIARNVEANEVRISIHAPIRVKDTHEQLIKKVMKVDPQIHQIDTEIVQITNLENPAHPRGVLKIQGDYTVVTHDATAHRYDYNPGGSTRSGLPLLPTKLLLPGGLLWAKGETLSKLGSEWKKEVEELLTAKGKEDATALKIIRKLAERIKLDDDIRERWEQAAKSGSEVEDEDRDVIIEALAQDQDGPARTLGVVEWAAIRGHGARRVQAARRARLNDAAVARAIDAAITEEELMHIIAGDCRASKDIEDTPFGMMVAEVVMAHKQCLAIIYEDDAKRIQKKPYDEKFPATKDADKLMKLQVDPPHKEEAESDSEDDPALTMATAKEGDLNDLLKIDVRLQQLVWLEFDPKEWTNLLFSITTPSHGEEVVRAIKKRFDTLLDHNLHTAQYMAQTNSRPLAFPAILALWMSAADRETQVTHGAVFMEKTGTEETQPKKLGTFPRVAVVVAMKGEGVVAVSKMFATNTHGLQQASWEMFQDMNIRWLCDARDVPQWIKDYSRDNNMIESIKKNGFAKLSTWYVMAIVEGVTGRAHHHKTISTTGLALKPFEEYIAGMAAEGKQIDDILKGGLNAIMEGKYTNARCAGTHITASARNIIGFKLITGHNKDKTSMREHRLRKKDNVKDGITLIFGCAELIGKMAGGASPGTLFPFTWIEKPR